jgi:hypothetical protein
MRAAAVRAAAALQATPPAAARLPAPTCSSSSASASAASTTDSRRAAGPAAALLMPSLRATSTASSPPAPSSGPPRLCWRLWWLPPADCSAARLGKEPEEDRGSSSAGRDMLEGWGWARGWREVGGGVPCCWQRGLWAERGALLQPWLWRAACARALLKPGRRRMAARQGGGGCPAACQRPHLLRRPRCSARHACGGWRCRRGAGRTHALGAPLHVGRGPGAQPRPQLRPWSRAPLELLRTSGIGARWRSLAPAGHIMRRPVERAAGPTRRAVPAAVRPPWRPRGAVLLGQAAAVLPCVVAPVGRARAVQRRQGGVGGGVLQPGRWRGLVGGGAVARCCDAVGAEGAGLVQQPARLVVLLLRAWTCRQAGEREHWCCGMPAADPHRLPAAMPVPRNHPFR